MSKFALRFLNDESGATAIEYSLMITMIAVVIAAVVGSLGGHARDAFQKGADIFKAN